MTRKIKLIGLSAILAASIGTASFLYSQSRQSECCTAEMATCSPKGTCKACKNCKYCKHCSKEGGSCSVCRD